MKRPPEEVKRASIQYRDICRAEVEWYRRFGKYPDRIKHDGHGVLYVVGDWSWNRMNPTRREVIEDILPRPERSATP